MKPNSLQPVLELTRGETVESIHFGAIAVVNRYGKLVASYGNPDTVTYLRSSAKPFQALPFVEAGGPAHFGLSPREIAMMCASHSGTDEHVRVVSGMQEKIGIAESDLKCGTHIPPDKPTADALIRRDEQPTPNRHNCSGKHCGMLAYAVMNGESSGDYLDPGHPVQVRILAAVAEMCSLPVDEIEVGTDGCSAPNFAFSLRHAAWGFARLADPADLPPTRAQACRQITDAMTAYPGMVSGPGKFDQAVMEAFGGRLVAKSGAEGYLALGIMPGVIGPLGVGIAIKIADGDGVGRARPAVALEVLRQLGAASEAELQALAEFGPVKPMANWRKLLVGELRPTFKLN